MMANMKKAWTTKKALYKSSAFLMLKIKRGVCYVIHLKLFILLSL